MNGKDPSRIDLIEGEEIVARRLRHADDGVGHGDLACHVHAEVVQSLLLQQLGEALVGQVVDGDHASPRGCAEEAGKEVVRAEDDVAVDQSHPHYIRGRGDRPLGARDPPPAAQIEPAKMRVRRQIGMETGAEIGHPGVAEKVELDVVAFRDLVQQVIQIPADAGERLVKRADIDADAQPRIGTPGAPDGAADAFGEGAAQRADDGPEHPWRMVTVVRKIIIFVVIVAVVAAGAILFFVTTSKPGSAGMQALLARVPESAEAFAIIPGAGAVERKARANPVTRAALESWPESHSLPPWWLIGGADVVVWKSGKETRTFADLDGVRALLARVMGADVSGGPPGMPIDAASLAEINALASKLPPGDALVVQRSPSRGAYPPIGRPAVTSIRITPADVFLDSAAPASSRPEPRTPLLRLPHSAVLSGSFAEAPRVVTDLNRLFGAKVSELLAGGGMISIYNVDTRKLLPRPLGVIVIPADPARRAILDEFVKRLDALGARTATRDDMLALSFDDSIDRFMRDSFDAPPRPDAEWTVRIDPQRMVPILQALGENVGLRIVASRLYRSARDLDRWIGGLEQAKSIEATESTAGGVERLQVRIASK